MNQASQQQKMDISKAESTAVYSSADLLIDPKSGEISTTAEKLRLSAVPLRVLNCLLAKPQQVVSRTELFDEVWPNQIISDDVLTKAISDLRAQLAKLTEQKLIVTIPKAGYRWQADVNAADLASVTPHSPSKTSEMVMPEHSKKPENINNEPAILSQTHAIQKTASEESFRSSAFKRMLPWGLALSLASLIFVLVWSNFDYQPATRVVVLPVEFTHIESLELAQSIELEIKSLLLNSQSARYLSAAALSNRQPNDFYYFNRELSADWIIESRILQREKHHSITLNLVDARTALVMDSIEIAVATQTNEKSAPDSKMPLKTNDLIKQAMSAFAKTMKIEAYNN